VQVRDRELSTSNEELRRAPHAPEGRRAKALIMQEKLPPLGALTLGYRPRDQEPLNFINNFAELHGGPSSHDLRRLQGPAQQARLDPGSVAMIEEIVANLRQTRPRSTSTAARGQHKLPAMPSTRVRRGRATDVDVNAPLAGVRNPLTRVSLLAGQRPSTSPIIDQRRSPGA
jgi:hypothetical protein